MPFAVLTFLPFYPSLRAQNAASVGDILAATAEDVELAVAAARTALKKNKGRDWASASGAHRAKYLRAIAAKVLIFIGLFHLICQ